ncbi:unnamed protein product [Polarella glacialis]|uniref:Uncharacterized protein n=1 Tax=Polarella glacialis TaxID=89957 RepID=A0A813JIS1_POLGL|nr:unnamed protein product [Polarella glacialis]
MDRYGDVKHIYAPPNVRSNGSGGRVPGMWWPDYGPMTVAFSEQYGLHPTNTIFQNVMAKPQKRKELMADPIAREASSGGRGGPPPLNREPLERETQFRRVPHTEALMSSTFIQPYKSGGAAKEIRVGAWHTRALESHEAHEEAQATLMSRRTLTKQTLQSTMSPTRTLSAPSLGLGSRGSATWHPSGGSGGEASPSWIAPHTVASRPLDAAGLAKTASSMNSHHVTGLSDFGINPECASATFLASRSMRHG